jgi:allantoinase
LIRLLEYMRSRDRVWFCTGADIAHHWRKEFPAGGH